MAGPFRRVLLFDFAGGFENQVEIPAPPCPSAWGWSWNVQHGLSLCHFWSQCECAHELLLHRIDVADAPGHFSLAQQAVSSQRYTLFHEERAVSLWVWFQNLWTCSAEEECYFLKGNLFIHTSLSLFLYLWYTRTYYTHTQMYGILHAHEFTDQTYWIYRFA